MKIPPIQGFFAILIFCAAFAGAPATGASLPATPQQAVPNIPPDAGPNRPANVPDGYVITPFGFFDPSCVQSLAQGEHLLADGRIEYADGTVEGTAAVCTHPHYMQGGNPASAAPTARLLQKGLPPAINGWVEAASITTGSTKSTYGGLVAIWTVPDRPLADDGQILYYFPGFEDINNTESILQPVLGWYQGRWSIASWNCCLKGIATSSPGVSVHSGDKIYGSVTSTCGAGTLACRTWNVLTLDMTTGKSTTLGNTPSEGQTFNWGFAGVLEAYFVKTCGDFPMDGQVSFYDVTIFSQYLHPISYPKWSTRIDTTDTPQCHYAVKLGAATVTVDY